MHAPSSVGMLDAPRDARRACRSRTYALLLDLAPTSRSLRLETDDERIVRYVRTAYGATLADTAGDASDRARLMTGAAKTIVTFNGVDVPRTWTGAGRNPWRSGAYIVDQLVWRALAGERVCTALYACAVLVNGRAVILAGDSGVGKTTLALALQRLGAFIIGDEMLVIRPTSSTVDAIDRRLSIRWASGDPLADPALYDVIRKNATTIGAGRARFLALDRRVFGTPPAPAPLAATFVVSRGAGSPRITTIGAARTALAIAPFVAPRPNGLDEVARLADLVGVGRCYTLEIVDPNTSARAVLAAVSTC